jgi:hypothetical protein
MNNTRTLAIVAAVKTATLVVGLTVAVTMTTSAFAGGGKRDGQDKYMGGGQDSYKKDGQNSYKKGTRDNRNDGGSDNQNGNTVTILKSQNKGFASGWDTAVNQEADNTICTHPSTNCLSEGSETPVVTNNTSSDDGEDGGHTRP